MENKEIQKPIIIEMEETKMEMVQVINKAIQVRKVPFYFIDMILSELGSQIKEGAKNELSMAKAQVEEPQKSNKEVA